MNKDDYFVLQNGVLLPKQGFGTYQLVPGDETYNAIMKAIDVGVRHFDTSIIYKNEKDIGKAIVDSGVARDEIFITAKLPPHVKNEKGVIRMFERTLKNLGLEYLDAYIINAPGPFNDLDGDYDEGNVIAYKTLEALYNEKRVRAIGVSQFKIHHLQNILDNCDIVPHINQISYFVGHTQDELVSFCEEQNILIQGFSPLGKGYLLKNPILNDLAKTYRVTPSQLALRYNLQKGVASIPKAATLRHISENTHLDFIIKDQHMERLDAIDDDPRQYND